MATTKIAILGGGIAGLTAAFHLSRTQALRDRFDVTVYQIGWRLGGKIASGRDPARRNLEHGLHVWFGCYDNAFAMLQDAYAKRPAAALFKTWTDAVKPQPFTPIGMKVDDTWSYWPITWPSNRRVPGHGGLQFTLWAMITRMVDMLRQTLEDLALDFPLPAHPQTDTAPNLLDNVFDLAAALMPVNTPGGALANFLATAGDRSFLDVVKATQLWADALNADSAPNEAGHRDAILDLLKLLNDSFKTGPALKSKAGTAVSVVRDLLDIGQAFIRGLTRDILEPDQPFEALDRQGLEFRDWLVKHGADRGIVANSSIIRALYDTAFQYIEGDQTKPSYAAGTAAGVLTRLIATYKGDMLWEIQAGMGEAVIAPIYEVLLDRGVQFRFFRKVRRLELSGDKKLIDKIHLDRQADVKGDAQYRPTFNVGGLTCWGSTPDWNQLVNGQQLATDGVDFESHWDSTRTGQEVLARGADFDAVVLAISMGAYQPHAEPRMCDELIAASSKFANFVNIPIVPTMSLQLWCDVTTAVLGWDMRKPAAVAGPGPLSVWADMSQVLAFEPTTSGSKPKSLHYLCGTYASSLFKEPSTKAGVPAQATAEVREQVVKWLQESSLAAWDVACDGKSFRWEMLAAPSSLTGAARLDAQYMRANIHPGECCVGSPAGTTEFRLGPTDHGFDNLFLAGEAARSGCNTSSVEGAVMTGMAAALAISKEKLDIVGYEFLSVPPSRFLIKE